MKRQTQMVAEHPNILSAVMLKNDKLSNGNVRLRLVTPEICQARNSSSNPRNMRDIKNVKMFLINYGNSVKY